MLLYKLVEYLCYLVMFVLLLELSDAATTIPIVATVTPPPAKTHESTKRGFEQCDSGFSWMCLKLEFAKLIERLTEQQELQLLPGISVVRAANATEPNSNDMMAEVARSYPNDPSSRINGYIIKRLNSFLQSRYLRLQLIDPNAISDAHSATETGRKGKFGKKGGLEAIIAAGIMMKGTLMALGLGAIALMAGKALMTALMALTLSGVVGLKSLANSGGKSTTYEIVAKPIYTSSHSHSVSHDDGHAHSGHYGGHSGSGYGGYARSLQLDMPNHLQPQPALRS